MMCSAGSWGCDLPGGLGQLPQLLIVTVDATQTPQHHEDTCKAAVPARARHYNHSAQYSLHICSKAPAGPHTATTLPSWVVQAGFRSWQSCACRLNARDTSEVENGSCGVHNASPAEQLRYVSD